MSRKISRYRLLMLTLAAFSIYSISSVALAARPTTPGTPSGNADNRQVSLHWAPSQDDNEVAGYNVFVNDAYLATVFDNAYTGEIDTSRDNIFHVTAFDTPLPGETRAYSSRSEDFVLERIDTQVPSPTVPVSGIDTSRPSTPDGLILVSAVSDSIVFSWTPATDNVEVLGYNVYRQGDYFDTVFTTRYIDNSPLPGVANAYSVVAFDAAKNYSSRSSELTITPPESQTPETKPVEPQPPVEPPVNSPEPTGVDTQPPTIPEGLSLPSVTRDAVTFTWNPSTDNVAVDGYNVYRNGSYFATVSGTSFIDLEPILDGTLAYSVVAFDESRNYSSRSEEIDVDSFNEPASPEPPVTVPPNDDGENVPVFDPANRFPSPDPNDPFGSLLEVDPEVAEPGGPPTTPKNLRVDLVSNDWAEFSWAPANDDVGVVAYNIYRSDGVNYTVSPDLTGTSAGSQAELDKYWSTTSFIDCNYTRFDTRVHNCRANRPVPGKTYEYQVTAVDRDGNESPFSNPLSITYHLRSNAPVPLFDDFYKMPDDRFAQSNDLSQTRFFLDEFDLVFNDEFNGTSVDATKWQTELTWKDSIIINGEQQYFVRTQENPEFGYDPFSFDGENLTISAVPTPDELRENLPPVCDVEDPTGNARCEFLSGALSSHDRFSFIYGYVEGRMKVGGTPGMLSSFYLYHRYKGSGVNLHAPEIDIVEYLGENPFGAEDAFQTYHFEDVNSGLTRSAPTMSHSNPTGDLYSDDFHTFGVLWEPQLIIWYIDGQEVKRMTGPMVARRPMNIVNYLVAGSAWAPTPDLSDPSIFPLEFDVDYIRVYQRDAYKGTASFGP